MNKFFWENMDDGLYYRGFSICLDSHSCEAERNVHGDNVYIELTESFDSREKQIEALKAKIDIEADKLGIPKTIKCLKAFNLNNYKILSLNSKNTVEFPEYKSNVKYRFSNNKNKIIPSCGICGFHVYFNTCDLEDSYNVVCEMSGLYDVDTSLGIAFEYMTLLDETFNFTANQICNTIQDTEFLMNCMNSNLNLLVPSAYFRSMTENSFNTQLKFNSETKKFELKFDGIIELNSSLVLKTIYKNLVLRVSLPSDLFDDCILNDEDFIKTLRGLNLKSKYYLE